MKPMKKLLLALLTFTLAHSALAMKPFFKKATEQVTKKLKLNPALYRAAERGDAQEVERLLALGADPNAGSFKRSRSALRRASAKGHLEVCKILVGSGANISAVNSRGNDALILAACHGHTEICTLLIDAGANINVKGQDGMTPLLWAAYYEHPQTCKLLLARGADIFAQDNNGYSFRFYAKTKQGEFIQINKEHLEYLVATLIAQKGDVNIGDLDGKTLLHHAAFWNLDGLTNQLINARADVNTLHKYGRSAFQEYLLFSKTQESSIDSMFINAGAQVNDETLALFFDYLEPEKRIAQLVFSPDLSDLSSSKKDILHLLLCFKNTKPPLPKDIQHLILAKLASPGLSNLMIARKLQGKTILNIYAPLAIGALYEATILRLKKAICWYNSKEKSGYQNPTIIDFDKFEIEFRDQIWQNICARLAQPKLLCNNSAQADKSSSTKANADKPY